MKIITAKTFTSSIFLALVLTACGGGPQPIQNSSSVAETNQLSQQSVNAVVWYNTSAENAYIYEQSYKMAAMMTEINMNAGASDFPNAVVLDIDETVLDNSPYMVELIKRGEVYSQESWAAWVMKMKAKPLPGVEEYLKYCEKENIEVFYISNRSIDHLQYTLKNMMNYNLPFADEAHVILKQDTSDKTERRNMIETDHNVLLYIGDNLLDFDSMFEDRSANYGKLVVEDNKEHMLPRHLLLPNPMYGQWEKVYSLEGDVNQEEKAKNKVDFISTENKN